MGGDIHIFDGKDIKTYIDDAIGSSTGDVSKAVPFTNDISGVTAPAAGTTGTDIDTLDYSGSAENGQRFELLVPTDYNDGDLEIWVQYRMSTSEAQTIRVRTQAKIVDISAGSIDSASYPLTNQDLTVQTDTDVEAVKLFELTEGDFASGDVVQAYVRRDGSADSHTGLWKVIGFFYKYTARLSGRAATSVAEVWDDYAAETATTPGTIGTDIDTEDFSPTVDNAQKVVFLVPQNWDGTSDAYLYLSYAMSTQESGKKCRFQIGGEIANTTDGSVDTVSEQEVYIWPANLTADAPQDDVMVLSVAASAMHAGDKIEIYLRRKGSDGTNDTHDGSFRGITAYMNFSQVATSGFTAVTTWETYLEFAGFGTASGTITGVREYPSYAGDFEGYWKIESSSAAATLPMAFAGRLGANQTTIKSIKIPMAGSAANVGYRIRVYVDGQGSSAVYDSGSQNTTDANRFLTSLTDANLTSQPTGEKRFFVDVLVTADSSEILYVGRPYVEQE
jgi:hypothetical protein